MAIAKKLNRNFFKTWTPEMAYVLGFFAADGNMVHPKSGAYFISFHITDKIVLQKIRRVIGSNHKIAIRTDLRPNHKVCYRLQIGSKEWFTDLENLGFSPRKSLHLRLPDIPVEFQGDFVRGYFDGDGCVYFAQLKFADRRRPRWILMTLFTSGSKAFLEDLHVLLRAHGIKGGSVKNKKQGFELTLSHRDSIALFQLMYHTVPATELYLPRKYQRFEKAIRVLYKNAGVAQFG